MPPMSPGETVSNIVFPSGPWKPPTGKVKNVNFRNVSFSKTSISQVTFTECKFEDCLFIGTQFEDVEFHGCDITNCTLWKIRLSRVYLRPQKIKFSDRYRVEAANVGLSLYQAMLSNFTEQHQDIFFMEADILFRKWKRYQIKHDLRQENSTKREAYWAWICSWTHEKITGFGYRPTRFFIWTLFLFFAVSGMNYVLIGDAIQVNGATAGVHISFVDAVFYTFSVLTVLGFSSVSPVSDCAKILSVLEALASIGWLGIFTAVLVKRFLR